MAWGGNDGAVEKWIKQLEENDPKLVSLHILSIRRISTTELTAIFKAAAGNTILKELYCSGHSLDRAAMEQLSELLTLNDTLELLNIGNAQLGENPDLFSVFCEGLAVNEGLQTLDLENKGLGHHHGNITVLVKSIQQHPTLKNVYLGRNELDDSAADALGKWLVTSSSLSPSLRCLRLDMNSISNQGAQSLAKILSLSPAITETGRTVASALEILDLSENPLLDGAADLAATISTSFSSLHTLKMNHVCTPKDAEDLQLPPSALDSEQVERALETQNEMQLERASPFGNALMSALCEGLKTNQQCLERIWLDQNGIESSGLSQMDQDIKGLKEIHLRGNRIDDTGTTCLSRCTSLQRVDVGGNLVGCDGLATLLDTQLEHIGLFNNRVQGFGDKTELPRFESSGVQTLDIGGNGISLLDVEAMVRMLLDDGLPHLTLLEIGGNVEDRDMDAWDQWMNTLKKERPDIQVAWKRLAKEMDTSKPPL